MTLKALESRLETVETENAAMREEQKKILEAVQRSKDDSNQLILQLMQRMNERFDEMSSRPGNSDGHAASPAVPSAKSEELREPKAPVDRQEHIITSHSLLNVCSRDDRPIFKGEDVEGWLRSLERYFRVTKTPDCEKLDRVLSCLEGSALQWFLWTEDRYSFIDWNDFKVQIGRRFSHALLDNILHQFLNISQEGSVLEYMHEYERLSVYLPTIQDLIMEQTFMKGLKPDIQAEMSRDEPAGLRDVDRDRCG